LPDSRLISGLVFYRRVQGKEAAMGSLIEEIRRREAAARAEADRLRIRIEELSGDLARAEEQASRLAIAREEVTRVMEEPAAADPPGGQDGRPARPAGRAGPVSRIGAVTVPPWQEGSDASVLPRVHQDLLEVVQFAAAAGLDTKKAKVEGLRSRLKLLAEAPGGLFTLPDHSGKTPKPGR
jgi:hypothetical protein